MATSRDYHRGIGRSLPRRGCRFALIRSGVSPSQERRQAQPVAHRLVHLPFRLANGRQARDHFGEPRLRDDHHAVLVGDDDVAARHRMAGDGDGKAHGAGTAARRRIGRDADAVARQADHPYAGQVAHAAIGDEARCAAVARHAEHEVAGHRAAGVIAGGGDDDVARLHPLERGHQRQIVRRTGIAGQRHAAEGGLLGDRRLDPVVERAAAAQRVDDEARGRSAQRVDERCRGPNELLVLNAWRFVEHCHILRQGKPW